MRCNRLTLNVKHYDNGGGACSNRDKKGLEEQKNISILSNKWPGCFSANPKRRNEVIMRWKNLPDEDDDGEDVGEGGKGRNISRPKVRQTIVKKAVMPNGLNPNAILRSTTKVAKLKYIADRCKKANGKTVKAVVELKYIDGNGLARSYRGVDLKYDLAHGFLSITRK